MDCIRILAVNDPAVGAYTNKENQFLKVMGEKLNIAIKMDVINFADYYNELMDAFKNNNYDIVMVAGHLWLASFVKKGYLSSFEVENDEIFDYQDVLEKIREEMLYENKQYLLPSFCDGHMVLYHKPEVFFDKSEPVTIKNITNVLETYASKPMPTFVLKAHPSEVFLDFLPYLRGFGVEPFNEKGEPLFNCSEGIRAFKRYKYLMDFASKKVLSFGNEEVKEEIQKNRCFLGLTWGGQLAAVMDENCDTPSSWNFNYLEKPWNVTWSFGINSKSLNKKLALLVMKELTSKKIDIQVGRICGNPTRISSFAIDENKYRWYKPVKKMIEASIPLAKFPQLPDAIGIVTEELCHGLTGTKKPEQAFADAEIRVRELVLK